MQEKEKLLKKKNHWNWVNHVSDSKSMLIKSSEHLEDEWMVRLIDTEIEERKRQKKKKKKKTFKFISDSTKP